MMGSRGGDGGEFMPDFLAEKVRKTSGIRPRQIRTKRLVGYTFSSKFSISRNLFFFLSDFCCGGKSSTNRSHWEETDLQMKSKLTNKKSIIICNSNQNVYLCTFT